MKKINPVQSLTDEVEKLRENQATWVSDAAWQKGIATAAQKERDEAQAKCAEMRDLLGPKYPGKISFAGRVEWHAWHLSVEHALSSNCGKDFVPRAEVKPLVDALTLTHEACNEVAAYGSCDCDLEKHPEEGLCPFCLCVKAADVAKEALALAVKLGFTPPIA